MNLNSVVSHGDPDNDDRDEDSERTLAPEQPLGDTLPPRSAMEETGDISMQDSKNADPNATLPSIANPIDPSQTYNHVLGKDCKHSTSIPATSFWANLVETLWELSTGRVKSALIDL